MMNEPTPSDEPLEMLPPVVVPQAARPVPSPARPRPPRTPSLPPPNGCSCLLLMSVFALLFMVLFQGCNRLISEIDREEVGRNFRVPEWLWQVGAVIVIFGSVYLAAKAERVWARYSVESGPARNVAIWLAVLFAIPLALVLFIVVTCA